MPAALALLLLLTACAREQPRPVPASGEQVVGPAPVEAGPGREDTI